MIASLSENGVGTCRRNMASPPIKASVFSVVNGGRTWARTKDPLIKRQQFFQCFQRRFRLVLPLDPCSPPWEAFICRNDRAPLKRSAAVAHAASVECAS
jgi:hypothetical protein